MSKGPKEIRRVIFSGGGTAGHVFPTLAVIDALKKIKPDIQILYVGSKRGFEGRYLPKTGLPFKTIPTGKIRKYFDFIALVQNLIDLFKIPFGFLKSLYILLKFKPEAIFLKGGYVSLPIGLSAIVLRIPFLVHESDFELGLSNRILAPFAKKVAFSFPYPSLKGKNWILSGNPVRPEILAGDRNKGKAFFGLQSNLPTILVIGGSQGARRINQAVVGCLEDLLNDFQLIHLVGELDWVWVKKAHQSLSPQLQKRYKIYKFLDQEMAMAYAVADLIISRGGANALSEISAWAKPSLLIPLPGHQEKNVLFYTESGASWMIRNSKLNSQSLLKKIKLLFSQPQRLQEMSEASSRLAYRNAAEVLAKHLLSLRR